MDFALETDRIDELFNAVDVLYDIADDQKALEALYKVRRLANRMFWDLLREKADKLSKEDENGISK